MVMHPFLKASVEEVAKTYMRGIIATIDKVDRLIDIEMCHFYRMDNLCPTHLMPDHVLYHLDQRGIPSQREVWK